MNHRLRVLGMVTTIVIAGCAAPAPPAMTDAERSAIADTLRGIARVFEQGIEALDVDRFSPYFASDPELAWANDAQLMLVPHDSLMSIYRGVYRGFRSVDFTWDTLHVSTLARDAGVLSGAGHFSVTDTTGGTVRQAVAVTYVFVRRDAGWQLLHGHASHRVLQ